MARRSGLWRSVACAYLAALPIAMASTSQAQDAIVGTWVGMLKQDEGEPFETRLTFVSPKGGVSRYPASPCGGILAGGPKGEGYQFTETITWGTTDELKSAASAASPTSASPGT